VLLSPGTSVRQPVHTVYGGAHLFTPGICTKLGKLALRSLEQNGPFPEVDDSIMDRVRNKLSIEPIEDYRIDFEDGYGNRSDEEENQHAEASAKAVAEAMRDSLLPPFIGIRVKPFNAQFRTRSFQTLELFLSTLLHHSGGKLPANFVVTLPKIEGPDEPSSLASAFDMLESKHFLNGGPLKFEFLVETPKALMALPQILDASQGRATAAHFGAFDYLASIDIAAPHQSLLHPSCDFARNMMKASLSQRGVFFADGVTNILPVGTRDDVQRGWSIHSRNVRHALESGFYQGWDVHPAQLVSRYATVFKFFREGWEDAALRRKNFRAMSAQATLTGNTFDDLASIRGLHAYLDRALGCRAISQAEVDAIS
jgi:citrate lyase beta subunit